MISVRVIKFLYFKTGRTLSLRMPKGKAIQLQAWTDPEGPEGLGSQISRQLAQESGKVVSPTHRPPLPLGNIPGTHFY